MYITDLSNDYDSRPFHIEGEFIRGNKTAFQKIIDPPYFGGKYSEYYYQGIQARFQNLEVDFNQDDRVKKQYKLSIYHFSLSSEDGFDGYRSFDYVYSHQKIIAGEKKIGSFILDVKNFSQNQ